MSDGIYPSTSTSVRQVISNATLVAISTLDLDGKIRLTHEKMSNTYELYQKGKQHLADGMPAQAIVSLEKAKRHEPRKASIREALGIAYLHLGRFEEAAAEFRAMVDITPTDAYGYYGLERLPNSEPWLTSHQPMPTAITGLAGLLLVWDGAPKRAASSSWR